MSISNLLALSRTYLLRDNSLNNERHHQTRSVALRHNVTKVEIRRGEQKRFVFCEPRFVFFVFGK